MGKASLSWWILFAQTDFDNVYNKTKLKLHDELKKQVNIVEKITMQDMRDFQDGAMDIVKSLQNPDLPMPKGTLITSFEMKGLNVCKQLSNGGDNKSVAIAVMLQTLQEANLGDNKLLGKCKTCGNLFLQASHKRKKLFCITQCKTKFNTSRKHND